VKNSDSLRIHAHAKINLYLEVVGKRPDGYHDIETLFHSIGLHDDVLIRKQPGQEIIVHCDDPQVPCDERNLAHRAAKLLIDSVGRVDGVEITIQKRIPVGAGLGGGSADAAAVLWGMNRLFELNLTPVELARLGVELGADVPFCLSGGAALGEGIGEILTALPAIDGVPLVLVNPGFEISAAWAYRNLNFLLTQPAKNVKIPIRCLRTGDIIGLAAQLHNRLEEPVFARYPVVAELKTQLAESPGSYGALMSGSGATVFALMQNSAKARQLVKNLEGQVAFCTVTATSPVGLSSG
jgi:4-diphosphocytidyl-2-C-methyl-D-erythritol kinase